MARPSPVPLIACANNELGRGRLSVLRRFQLLEEYSEMAGHWRREGVVLVP